MLGVMGRSDNSFHMVKTERLEVTLGPWPEENAAPTKQERVGVDSRPENASWDPVNTGEQSPTVVSGLFIQSSEHPNSHITPTTVTAEHRRTCVDCTAP